MWLAILGLYCVHVPPAAAQAGKLFPLTMGCGSRTSSAFERGS
jgi:hypothetical protein